MEDNLLSLESRYICSFYNGIFTFFELVKILQYLQSKVTKYFSCTYFVYNILVQCQCLGLILADNLNRGLRKDMHFFNNYQPQCFSSQHTINYLQCHIEVVCLLIYKTEDSQKLADNLFLF